MFWHCFIDSSPRIHWSFTLAEPCFFTQTPICVTLVLRGIGIVWYCMTLPGSTLTGLHLCHSYPEINISHVFLGPDLHVITLLSMSSHLILDFIIFSAFQIICSNHFHFYQHKTLSADFIHCCKSSYSILSYHHPLLTMIMMPMMILTSRPVKNILRIFIPARATQRTNDWKHKAAAAEGLETSLNDRNPQNSSQDETHFITTVTSNVGDWT